MSTLQLTRDHDVDVRRKDDHLMFAVHDGRTYITLAYVVDEDRYWALLRREVLEFTGEIEGRSVKASVGERIGDFDVIINGEWAGCAPWNEFLRVCRDAWGGEPFKSGLKTTGAIKNLANHKQE